MYSLVKGKLEFVCTLLSIEGLFLHRLFKIVLAFDLRHKTRDRRRKSFYLNENCVKIK